LSKYDDFLDNVITSEIIDYLFVVNKLSFPCHSLRVYNVEL